MDRIRVLLLVLGMLTVAGLSGASDLAAQDKGKSKKNKKKGEVSASKNTPEKAKIDYLFIEANTQYLQGNKAESIGLFKEVIGLDPGNDAAMYNIGKLYAELGDHENARRYCEQALSKNPGNQWYYVELVAAYERGHLPEKALSTQEALVKKFPSEKNALFDLAQMYISAKRYQDALNTYMQLEALSGMNEEVVFRMHQLYMFLNQPEKALVELNRLAKANPTESRYHQARYDIMTMMGNDAGAMQVLEDLLASNPNDGFALFALADYYKAKGQMEKSDEYLFRGFGNKGVDITAKVKIIAGMYQMSERDKAILPRVTKLSDILWATHPNSALSAGIRGDVFQGSEQLDSARHYYRKSTQLDPTHQEVWQELLFLDSDLKDDAGLKKDAEKALEYFPNQTTFLYFYGAGSERTGDHDEAIYAYEKLKKISSADKETRLQALLSLGSLYHKTKQYEKSDDNFEQALQMDPENPLTLNNYAYYLSLRNTRLADAEKMAMQALDKQPNSSSVQDTYGWILFLKGDLKSAEHYIARSAAAGGGAEVYEHLGDVQFKMGEIEKAKGSWQKAIDEGASNFKLEDKLKQTRQP